MLSKVQYCKYFISVALTRKEVALLKIRLQDCFIPFFYCHGGSVKLTHDKKGFMVRILGLCSVIWSHGHVQFINACTRCTA